MLTSTSRKLLLLSLLGLASLSHAQQVPIVEGESTNPIGTDPIPLSSPLEPVSLKLYHRFTSPLTLNPEWIERGELSLDLSDDLVDYLPLDTAWNGLEIPETLAEVTEEGTSGIRYEVSMRKPGQSAEDSSFVSIEPCHLFSKDPQRNLKESIVLHSSSSSSSRNARSFPGFKYSTSGPNACKLSASERSEARFALDTEPGGERGNVEVEIRKAFVLPTPQLPEPVEAKTPVQLDKEGKVIPPPAPKSFIQKYWMYIVPVLIVLMMGGTDDGDKGSKKQ